MKYLAVLLAGLLLAACVHLLRMTDDERARIFEARPAQVPEAAPGTVDAPDDASRVPGTDAALPPGVPAVAGSAARLPLAAAPPAPPMAGPAPTMLPSGLIVPVQGVAPSELFPTFDDDRGEGRVHEALDIMAPAGTPVLAVADGHVEKLFDSDRGGLTIYQFEPTGRHAYYYAHLERYAPGLREGQVLRQGEVVGYVGSSGNADPAAPHLHFAIFVLGPEKRWWEGRAIDPWPLLSGAPPAAGVR